MGYINVHQSIFAEFAHRYPYLADKVENWFASDKFEITASLIDGEVVTYNQLTKAYTYNRNTTDEVIEEDWGKVFGETLNSKLYNRGISQRQLATDTGISEVTISKYLCGSSIPSAQNISKIAKALGCTSSELIDF